MTPRGPDAEDGPRRFIRNWLTYDKIRSSRKGLLWKFVATIAALLVLSAMLTIVTALHH